MHQFRVEGHHAKGKQQEVHGLRGGEKSHINVMELKAATLAITTFTITKKKRISIQVRMDNMVALSHLMKMRGTQIQEFVTISKKIWNYLLLHKITITVQYLTGVLNVEADRESRDLEDSNEWKLDTQVFKKIRLAHGTPDIDLFGSRVSHQIPQYMPWKLDPFSKVRDAFHISWNQICPYAFPPFALIGRVLQKVQQVQASMILITPA